MTTLMYTYKPAWTILILFSSDSIARWASLRKKWTKIGSLHLSSMGNSTIAALMRALVSLLVLVVKGSESFLDKPEVLASHRLNISGKIPWQDLNLLTSTLPETVEEIDIPVKDINLADELPQFSSCWRIYVVVHAGHPRPTSLCICSSRQWTPASPSPYPSPTNKIHRRSCCRFAMLLTPLLERQTWTLLWFQQLSK